MFKQMSNKRNQVSNLRRFAFNDECGLVKLANRYKSQAIFPEFRYV